MSTAHKMLNSFLDASHSIPADHICRRLRNVFFERWIVCGGWWHRNNFNVGGWTRLVFCVVSRSIQYWARMACAPLVVRFHNFSDREFQLSFLLSHCWWGYGCRRRRWNRGWDYCTICWFHYWTSWRQWNADRATRLHATGNLSNENDKESKKNWLDANWHWRL